MDNYYSSVQLLQELQLKGLYGRGAIKSNSKHFPRHTILDESKCSRGDHHQAISRDFSMIAASWCDCDVVNMISNADASAITPVSRTVASESNSYPAPTCIGEYNKNMQGVDRLDQIRGRFSIADGHSYKRWHKKLALELIDVARANAYLTRRLSKPDPAARDPQRQFVMELAAELMNGKWADAPSEGRLIFGARLDGVDSVEANSRECIPSVPRLIPMDSSPIRPCGAIASKQIHGKKSRKRRRCIICRWEERYPAEVTTYCLTHGVCLCGEVHDQPPKPWMCPRISWTCWDKFHKFYLPNKLFAAKGVISRGSALAKMKRSDPGIDATGVQQVPTTPDSGQGADPAMKPNVVRQILI